MGPTTRTRTEVVRRSGLPDRRFKSEQEYLFASVCLEAGATYRGLQDGFKTPTKTVETLVLFNDSRNTTLALPVSRFSLSNVRTRLAESDKKWEEAKT